MNEATSTTETEIVMQLQSRLDSIAAEHEAAMDALEAAKLEFGEAALGPDPDKTTQAGERVMERQRDLLRIQAVRDALERRMEDARVREAVVAHSAKWDKFTEALARRHVAFEKAEKVAGPFFKAVEAAIEAARVAERLLPTRKILTPDGWVIMPSEFDGMANMKTEELAVVKKALHDMTKKSLEQGALALRVREFDRPNLGI